MYVPFNHFLVRKKGNALQSSKVSAMGRGMKWNVSSKPITLQNRLTGANKIHLFQISSM